MPTVWNELQTRWKMTRSVTDWLNQSQSGGQNSERINYQRRDSIVYLCRRLHSRRVVTAR
ncbi:protein of unknown function (plasmid) [Candidatus Promineifilum breve]|uniref:Uncharacterized protein n=1 Tax=Candidatus Promineifilum breve TaxID=1806508 RepID=A0A160T4W3_9CHLR|nr:protein of unknown function [Candidatus Promineifilum breve]CUS06458.1 protein of unknown function [Candidatus Promineifilum breve]